VIRNGWLPGGEAIAGAGQIICVIGRRKLLGAADPRGRSCGILVKHEFMNAEFKEVEERRKGVSLKKSGSRGRQPHPLTSSDFPENH